MPNSKPRQGRRRTQGRQVLKLVKSYDLDGNGIVSVTAARKYVKDNGLCYPAVINVRRNKHTVDSFFLSESGVFGLSYVEFNWFQFASLKPLGKKIDPNYGPGQTDWFVEEEPYAYEFSFI